LTIYDLRFIYDGIILRFKNHTEDTEIHGVKRKNTEKTRKKHGKERKTRKYTAEHFRELSIVEKRTGVK